MSSTLRILTASLVCFAAACGDDGPAPPPPEPVTISLFQAASDAVEVGQSTKLLFVVTPSDAKLMISDVGDVSGKTEASVSPSVTTTYHLVATKGTLSADKSITVTVGPQPAAGLKLEAATATPTAGDPLTITVTAITASGKTAPTFRGTVHLTSSDAKAELPADLVFGASDAGVKQVTVTLKTAGGTSVTGTDTASTARQATASVTVAPGAATACVARQAPTATAAGSIVGVSVVLDDAFGNVATSYAGTIRLTATDVRAVLPGDVTYVPLVDGGNHAFSAALLTTGVQTLTATDTGNAAIHCDATVAVTPGALKLVLTAPATANAGYDVPVNVAARDVFDNAILDYAGTVHFTTTDGGAAAPADLVFNGAQGGVATTAATFVTIGGQTLSATDGGAPAATGSADVAVHGLVYTPPTAGRVRLVANAASNTQIVQLDLVATERLEISSFFGGGPGSFAAGMNLPLDTTRVTGDATLFTPGNALVVNGTPPVPPVAIARLGDDHVLYTAVSRKRTTSSNFNQGTEVQVGQVFYSIRLKLQPAGTVGPVFDGAQASALFRAAVRDQFGDDFVSQSEFGLGRLEVR